MHNLATDEGLRAALEVIGPVSNWNSADRDWVRRLSAEIVWVRSADETERSSRDFQERLWERNPVSEVGRGNISVQAALDDPEFRTWLAAYSFHPAPNDTAGRVQFLRELYDGLAARLKTFVDAKTPRLKILRVIAALYPECMTTVVSRTILRKLNFAFGLQDRPAFVEENILVRARLDQILGEVGSDPDRLAERMALAWQLVKQVSPQATAGEMTEDLAPLPAARRTRGLTAVKGQFQTLLLTLDHVRNGTTRDELVEFLRSVSPEAKDVSLNGTISTFQGQFGVIRRDGDRYDLTEQGERLLESQEPSELADWLLTRILGLDQAILTLRDRVSVRAPELTAVVKAMNPGLTSDFGPQGMINWLRSLGVVETVADAYRLTERGRQWAERIDWIPEPLAAEVDPAPLIETFESSVEPVKLMVPALDQIVEFVQQAGHFDTGLIACLHASLWSNPRRHFAILTGLSGAGKTLLARQYAKSLIQGGSEQQLLTLPVQPGWYDPSALLGYVNPLRGDSYFRTGFLEFLLAAAKDPGRPYVAVLDEMNLSHPEQYMAPLLSAMETGSTIQLHNENEHFDGVPRGVRYPTNLVLIGTVNMDETTHGLSDKVLDRAFVHEFWDVNLEAYPRWGKCGIGQADEERTRAALTALMTALSPARLHFGWRVVDDVMDFLSHAAGGGVLPFQAALDSVIYAKVLPKLRGEDTLRFRDALKNSQAAMAASGLTQCQKKVEELMRDLETTGSARFWR